MALEDQDQELVVEFIEESRSSLEDIEQQFLTIEAGGENVDHELVNTVFRAIHSMKGVAGFLGLTTINKLAHVLESVLDEVRNDKLIPTSEIVDVMLGAADKLCSMLDDVEGSNNADVTEHSDALKLILETMQPIEETEETVASVAEGDIPAETDTPVTANPSDSLQDADEDKPVKDVKTELQGKEPAIPPVESKDKPSEKKAAAASNGTHQKTETSLRVPISVIDKLMNLVGELVLSRNQLLQSISSEQLAAIKAVGPRINQVTTELQDAVMQTRLQPVGNVFNRFTRVVRDLNKQLSKKCQLVLEGAEVEIDKTIVEALSDPMTHLVRNSLDHAIETPEERLRQGKTEEGTLLLSAVQEAGSVKIIIKDDGAGINAERVKAKAIEKGILTPERAALMTEREAARLIFEPGFSTAAVVSDVSGRGVGMDVVRTNIEKLGGIVDVDTQLNVGTTITITLPLTLAIMPALIVRSGQQFMAIPQISIGELVRLRRADIPERIGCIKGAKVLRSRGKLLPLIKLSSVVHTEDNINLDETNLDNLPRELDIAILEIGGSRFGLVADELLGSEEIVVKPLGQHFADCDCLAGATILGGGDVAMILDVKGIATLNQQQNSVEGNLVDESQVDAQAKTGMETVLLLKNHPDEQFAIPMGLIRRIEEIEVSLIDSVAGQKVLQIRGGSMPLLSLEDCINAKQATAESRVSVVVFEVMGREIGLIAHEVQDLCEVDMESDNALHREPGVMGTIVVHDKPTRVVSLGELAEVALPDWFADESISAVDTAEPTTILIAEDSGFFRKQLNEFLSGKGFQTVECEDGQAAWDMLLQGMKVDIVVTDLEMPKLDGFGLCKNIKQHPDLKHISVIALTSLSSEDHHSHALECGVDAYQTKLNQPELLCAVKRLVQGSESTRNLQATTLKSGSKEL